MKKIESRLKPLQTALEARESDLFTTNRLKIPAELLMENAGLLVAQLVKRSLKKIPDAKILIMAGPGNNGGDALVAARHLLSHDIDCGICMVDPSKKNLMVKKQVALLLSLSGKFLTEQEICADRSLIIVDGILGAGLNRPPTGDYLSAIRFINKQASLVISIDIPSGLSLEAEEPLGEHVRAHHTITFGPLKRAHISEPTKAFCGQVKAVSIGLFKKPTTNWWIRRQQSFPELFLPIPSPCHKGQFGHVLIFAGHPRFYGASKLAALAALRVGAGLLTIASVNDQKTSSHNEFMHIDLSNIDDQILAKIDSVVLGPGLSLEKDYQEMALNFINRLHKPTLVVLDADGLNLLKHPNLKLEKHTIICTPHPKEAANLLNCSVKDIERDRFKAIHRLFSAFGGNIIWLLKGGTPLVMDLDKNFYAFRGDLPLLSTGGMGDVLSGAIAGLYKQTASPIDALLLAISMQLETAKNLSKNATKGMLASELANEFPKLTRRKNGLP